MCVVVHCVIVTLNVNISLHLQLQFSPLDYQDVMAVLNDVKEMKGSPMKEGEYLIVLQVYTTQMEK